MKKLFVLLLLIPAFAFSQEASSSKEGCKQMNGVASYYANRFQGLRTATGEIFKHSNMTAASNFFKLNSWVRVTNLINNKSVIVRINDRMHPRMAKMGRVVDLTKTAALLLGGFDGLTKVRVEEISKNSLSTEEN